MNTNFTSLGNRAVDAPSQALQVREAFTKFVGQTFFGQMMKAMRSTQEKPAYFHGGQAEEVFQSQLDQALVDHMVEASAERFAQPIFARQFPRQAQQIAAAEAETNSSELSQLEALRRR